MADRGKETTRPTPWRRPEFPVLLAMLVLAGGLWGFMAALGAARSATPRDFDTAILLAFRTPGALNDPIGPVWFEEAMRDLTALGSTSVLIFVVAAVIFYLLIEGRRAVALFVFAAIAGGQVVSSLLKLGIDRPRPDLVPHLAEVYTLSFPSGHAMLSAVTYLTLGALLARVQVRRALEVYVMAVAVIATLLVGITRIYLAVHWPSDVLAGWSAGAAWAMLCWLVARWALRRRSGG